MEMLAQDTHARNELFGANKLAAGSTRFSNLAARDDYLRRFFFFLTSSGGQASSCINETQNSGSEHQVSAAYQTPQGFAACGRVGGLCPGVEVLQVHPGVPREFGTSPNLGCGSPRAMTPGRAKRRS